MDRKFNVAIVVGSLRKGSLNRMMAQAAIALAPASLALSFVDIGALPLYNDELESAVPAPWAAFRQAIKASDALLFVTPEYNRSIPGALKNAIDVGSRPYGQSVYAGKPAAIISVSPGALGAFGANHHLRQTLVFLDMPTMQQPEAYIGGAAKFFDADGKLVNDGTREFLSKFMTRFAAWVNQHAA
jgi:chromate reductase